MFGKKKNQIVMGCNVLNGLPVPSGSDITLTFTPDSISFVTNDKQTFNLSMDKVTNIMYYNETELEKVVSQSAPGMIVGAATFGIIGAMVGGRVKTKNEKTVKHFNIIKYDDKEILLETKDYYNSGKIVDEFRKIKPVQPMTVDL